jgi:hypothetical protein
MDQLNEIIAKHFSPAEISGLAQDLGLFVPQNVDPRSMARELYLGARRNLRLDVLFYEVYSRRAAALGLNLRPNLYELIAGTFNERDVVQISRNLGLDKLSAGLDAAGLIGWDNDDFYKHRKAQKLLETAENQGQYDALLAELKRLRPSIELTPFGQGQSQLNEQETKTAGQDQSAGSPAHSGGQVSHHYYGPVYHGDRVEGDKAGGAINKDMSFSGSGPTSLGGDAVAGTQVKDVEGDVTVGGDGERENLLALLGRINQDLVVIQDKLRPRDAEEAVQVLQQIADETQTKEPDGAWIVRKLRTVAEIAGAAGAATTAANQLAPHIEQAIQLALSLFG